MALDNFIGWSLGDKVAMLLAAQQALLTGQVTRVQTANGVYTEFNSSQTNVTQTLRKIEESIAMDPEPDQESPVWAIWAACAGNVRPAVTRQSHY